MENIIPDIPARSSIARWCMNERISFNIEISMLNHELRSKHHAAFVTDAAFSLAMAIDNRFDMETKNKCIDLLLWLSCELELYSTATIKTPLFALKMKQLEKAFEF